MYLLKGKADHSEIEQVEIFQRWMLDNLYDLAWEAEFKNLVTPTTIASVFRIDQPPFGIPFKKPGRNISAGDIIQIGPTFYLAIREGFREVKISKSDENK